MSRKFHFMRRPLAVAVVSGGPNDEGYYLETVAYELRGRRLFKVVTTDARDCDGRTSSFAEAVWSGDFRFHVWRNNGWAPYGWNNRPQFVIGLKWEAVGNSCRDYAAEAAGY